MATTLKDVAKLSGVHPSTVSRVLRGKENIPISAETRAKILKAVKELNYQPDQTARALRLKKSNAVGLVIPNISSPYFSAIAKILDRKCTESGYSLMICDTDEDQEKEIRAVNDLYSRGVDGLVIAPVQESDDHIRELVQKKFPFVLIDRCFDDLETNAVICNDAEAAYQVVSYLYDLGHKRIGFISGRSNLYAVQKRLDGYKHALKDFQLDSSGTLISDGGPTLESGYQSATKLLTLKQPPTAILISGSIITVGVMKAIVEQGFSVPDDISLIAFTDSVYSPYLICPLTTVSHAVEKIGTEAFHLLHHALTSTSNDTLQKITVDSRFFVRQSVSVRK